MQRACLDGVHELAVVARLLPVVAESVCPDELLDRDLRLTGPVSTHQADVLAGAERSGREEHLVARGHRHHQVRGERLLAGPGHAGTEPQSGTAGLALVDVPQGDLSPASEERLRRSASVDAGADDRRSLGVRASECLRREHGSRAGPQRRHRSRVEDRAQHSVRCIGKKDEAGDRRQPLLRVAWKRRHPLERCMSGPEHGHRAEVSGRIRGHVDLRRHRPVTAVVREEGLANRLERALGRNRFLDVPRRKHRNHRGQA